MTITTAASPLVDEELDVFVGRRVHQLMWDRQMTQTAMGLHLGIDQSAVARRLRGKLAWNARYLVAAASALGTTVSYLVGETDDATLPPTAGGGLRSASTVGAEGLEPPTPSV